MYHPDIIEQELRRYAERGIKPVRLDREESKYKASKIKELFVNDKYTRDLTEEETKFIKSEYVLSKVDFRYFAERYGCMELDAVEGGGVGPFTFWPSQERVHALIAARQLENYATYGKHGFSDGIFVAWHKSRQQGATAHARQLTLHRMVLHNNTRCFAASLDTAKVLEIYNRDKLIYDHLPPFLKPNLDYDTKGEQIVFKGIGSRITYQQSNQEAGIGTGQQFDVTHCTELSTWRHAERLWLDLKPAIPQSPNTFVGFESTAFRRAGFWYEFTENIRKKEPGYERWIYAFTPCYINEIKNRLIPPDNWEPIDKTKAYYDLVAETSIQYAGKTIRPSKEHLYWWETEYRQHKKAGSLHDFYANYPATPQQSFQHAGAGAFSAELLEDLRADCVLGVPYEAYFAKTA